MDGHCVVKKLKLWAGHLELKQHFIEWTITPKQRYRRREELGICEAAQASGAW